MTLINLGHVHGHVSWASHVALCWPLNALMSLVRHVTHQPEPCSGTHELIVSCCMFVAPKKNIFSLTGKDVRAYQYFHVRCLQLDPDVETYKLLKNVDQNMGTDRFICSGSTQHPWLPKAMLHSKPVHWTWA